MLGYEAGQEVPVLRLGGSPLTEPSSLGLRHRFAAERVFARQSRRLQAPFDDGKVVSFCSLCFPLGNLARKGDDEPEAVLEIMKFCFGDEPIPMEVRGTARPPKAAPRLGAVRGPGFEVQRREVVQD